MVDVFSRKVVIKVTTNYKRLTYTHFFKEMIENNFMDFNCNQKFKFKFKKENPKGKKREEVNFIHLFIDHNMIIYFLKIEKVNKNSIVEKFIQTLRKMLTKVILTFD